MTNEKKKACDSNNSLNSKFSFVHWICSQNHWILFSCWDLQCISVCNRHNLMNIKCICTSKSCNTDVTVSEEYPLQNTYNCLHYPDFPLLHFASDQEKFVVLQNSITCFSNRQKQICTKSDMSFLKSKDNQANSAITLF